MFKKMKVSFALLLVLSVLLISCSPAQPAQPAAAAPAAEEPKTEGSLSLKGKTIGIAVVGTDHFWDRTAFNSAVKTVEALGGKAIGVDAERDDQKHVANHENLIAQKPDAIISILGSGELMEPVFKKVREAGIPLFTVDHTSQYSINNSTSDNYYLGSQIGIKLAQALDGKGKVAVFNGFGAVGICQIRYDMFKYVLAKEYPEIEILQPELQDVVPNTIEDARQKTADLLQKYPKGTIDAIHVACWDIPAIGIVKALEEAGRTEIKVTGIDAGPDTLAIMAKPGTQLVGNVAQQPDVIAATAVYNVAKYLAGQAVPKTSYVSVIPVDPSTAAEVIAQLGY